MAVMISGRCVPHLTLIEGGQSVKSQHPSEWLPPSLREIIPATLGARMRCVYDNSGSVACVEIADVVDPADVQVALEKLEVLMAPIGSLALYAELGATFDATNPFPQDARFGRENIIEVFAEELADFPASIVTKTLRKWRLTEKERPTLCDIYQPCYREANLWRRMQAALESVIAG